MKTATRLLALTLACTTLLAATSTPAQDWPQWRGPNRDAKATGFNAPTTWPKELTQKWKITVGDGNATPALVGDKLYTFTLQNANEVIRCLDAASGKELWQDKYPAQPATGAAARHAGPRSSPTVADGKVITLGVRGTLSCLDAASGKVLWRKDDFKASWPRFFTSSSPIVVGGLCIAQLGGQRDGSVVAYDLATGNQKWKWTGDGAAYASPALLTVDGTNVIVAETDQSLVALSIADGKLLWQTPYPVKGRGYNASTPLVDGQTLIFSGSGRGTRAVRLEKHPDKLAAKELWTNPDSSVQFNTPVLKDGLLFGLSFRNDLFCLHADTGKTAWTSPTGTGRGFGSIIDAGPVLLALSPSAELLVLQPTAKAFHKLATYKVADSETYAYPIPSSNRLYIKDQSSLTLFTLD